MDGDEVVQIYVRDCFSLITRPLLELKSFQRIHIPAGKSKMVNVTLRYNDFTYLDTKMKPVLEPGEFQIMVSSSSTDIRLQKKIRI